MVFMVPVRRCLTNCLPFSHLFDLWSILNATHDQSVCNLINRLGIRIHHYFLRLKLEFRLGHIISPSRTASWHSFVTHDKFNMPKAYIDRDVNYSIFG